MMLYFESYLRNNIFCVKFFKEKLALMVVLFVMLGVVGLSYIYHMESYVPNELEIISS